MKRTIINNSDILKRGLVLLGISPEAYAFSLDKDRATIYRYLNNESKIPYEVISNLLDLIYDRGINIVDVLGIDNENDYLYHATNKEIIFPINNHINDNKYNDFGHGFYLGENLRQSSTWGKLGKSKMIYRFKKDKFKELKILDFNSLKVIDWLNYIAVNREKISFKEYPNIYRKYKKLESNYDMIKGKIGDSYSFEVLEMLYHDRIDIDQAEYSTCMMALGNQYCLKNDSFAKSLEADEVIIYDDILTKYFSHYSKVLQEKQNKNVELIINKVPNRHRVFSEYLKGKYE